MRYWTKVLIERLAARKADDGVAARKDRDALKDAAKLAEPAARRNDGASRRDHATSRQDDAAGPRDNAAELRDDAAGPRGDVLEKFQEIVEREWSPTGRAPLQRLLPDSRYSCIAPFWI